MEKETLDIINAIILISFSGLVLLALVRILIRRAEYQINGLKPPTLLRRDLILFLGMGLPLILLLIFRAANIDIRAQWWYPVWVIGSGLMWVGGVAYWVYYEFFIVERP